MNPVSMKYRGLFKKEKDLCETGRLFYTAQLGSAGKMKDVITKYKELCKNGK
jgi:hypothetical protein